MNNRKTTPGRTRQVIEFVCRLVKWGKKKVIMPVYNKKGWMLLPGNKKRIFVRHA